MSKSLSSKPGSKTFTRNRKASYNYEVLDTVEAGIALGGGEVKSIKMGQASIEEAFVQIENGEAWLWSAHVPQWQFATGLSYDPYQKRKLLMHRREIDELVGKVKQKGVALVPLKLYAVKGRIKVLVGVCRGKKRHEKRQREKERAMEKDLHKEKREYMV